MPDEMFFSVDLKSMRRGRRSPRTETCRPCCVWPADDPGVKMRGVVMDISPYGIRIRMTEILPVGALLAVQLMRDDDFEKALSPPVTGVVVRYAAGPGGITDHGLELERKPAEVAKVKPSRTPIRKRTGRRTPGVRLRLSDFKTREQEKR